MLSLIPALPGRLLRLSTQTDKSGPHQHSTHTSAIPFIKDISLCLLQNKCNFCEILLKKLYYTIIPIISHHIPYYIASHSLLYSITFPIIWHHFPYYMASLSLLYSITFPIMIIWHHFPYYMASLSLLYSITFPIICI